MAKKTRSKKTTARRKTARKAAPRKATTRAKSTRRTKPKSSAGAPSQLNGWITHTEFASTDPDATQVWLERVLKWKFRDSFPMPDGSQYLLFMYSEMGGGGIRPAQDGDTNTVPYVQVASVRAAMAKALTEGAQEMIPPSPITEDLWVACVRAPGGVAIGFAGPR